MRSSESLSFTSTPFRAESEVETAITSGIASPRACGQAITSTVTVRTTADSGCPSPSQIANVTVAAASAA
jgi:hypothetical protein